MICKGCGKELSEDQIFCSNCGLKKDVPQSQAPQGQVPPYPVPQSQAPQGQRPPYPMQQGQTPQQGQRPPYPMPQGQAPYNRIPPNPPIPPYPMAPYPMPPYPIPQGQAPYNRIPPNPPIPPYPLPPNQSYTPKTINPIVIVIIVFSVLAFLAIGLFVAVFIFLKASSSIEHARDIVYEEYYNDSSTQYTEDDTDLFTEDGSTLDDTYEYLYSYAELSDVISIDSDTRFASYNYSSYESIATYVYQFDSISWTESDFYTAIDEYCTTVANCNGFYYEENFSDGLYETVGVVTAYLSRNDVSLSVAATVDDTGYYVAIAISPISGQSVDSTYEYYSENIEGRTSQSFELGTEVSLDNGMQFRINDISVTELGDGTSSFDVNVDLSANSSNWNFYADDFVMVPIDENGNILTDAYLANSITDSDGYIMTTPFLLDTDYYKTYVASFILPSDITNIKVYATNLTETTYYDPIYYMDMQVSDY